MVDGENPPIVGEVLAVEGQIITPDFPPGGKAGPTRHWAAGSTSLGRGVVLSAGHETESKLGEPRE